MDCYHTGTESYGDFIHSLRTTDIGRWIHEDRLVLRGHASAAPRTDPSAPYVVFFQPQRRDFLSFDSHWQPIRALPRHVKRHIRHGLARLVVDECGESGQIEDLTVLDNLLGREAFGNKDSVAYLCQNRLLPNTFDNLTVLPFDYYVLDALTRTNGLLSALPGDDPLAQDNAVIDGKRFLLSLNATPRFPRLLMCSYLEHVGLLDDALVSLPELDYVKRTYSYHDEWLAQIDRGSLSFLRPAAERLISQLPLVVDETPMRGNQLIGVIPLEAYRSSVMSVVTETATHPGNHRITEKTAKVLGLGHPFVVYSHPQSVRIVREFGFSPYDDLIDQGYDDIEDESERLLAIGRELERLRNRLTSDPSEFWTAAREHARFNRTWAMQKFFPRYADEYLAPVLTFLSHEEIFDHQATETSTSSGTRDDVQVSPVERLGPRPSISTAGRIGESVGCSLRCDDIAAGKPYRLTSSNGEAPVTGLVRTARPYFFHTDAGPEQAITVDLRNDTLVCAVMLHNRTDACFERARHILVILHSDPRRLAGTAFTPDTAGMACPEPVPLFINFRPSMARYVSVVNLSEDPLHLSALRIIRHA